MFGPFALSWTAPGGQPPVPAGLTRSMISTSAGALELLCNGAAACSSTTSIAKSSTQTPIFFIHGGMGSASVWASYMRYLGERGIPAYAISMRGHGASWHPSYLRMVYGTTRAALGSDVEAGLKGVCQMEDTKEVVIIGHSSGGGLAQWIISERAAQLAGKVKGLALLDAVPGFGSYVSPIIAFWNTESAAAQLMVFLQDRRLR
jgi:pimeloyl-ACP methyl ester carboxylesterase